MPAGPLTRNTSRWPSLRHTTSTAGSTSPRAARERRHDGDDAGHAGHDRRNEQLVRHARIARLAGRREQAGRRDRRDLLADRQTRLGLERPVARACQLLLVERAEVGDRVVDRVVDVVVDACGVDLVVGDAKAGRGDLDPVETGQRVADGGVAALADVLDQLDDRRPQ